MEREDEIEEERKKKKRKGSYENGKRREEWTLPPCKKILRAPMPRTPPFEADSRGSEVLLISSQ